MNTRLICIAIAATMGISPLAQARDWQRQGDGDGRGWDRNGQRGDHGRRWDQGQRHDPGQRHGWQRDRDRPAVVQVPQQQYPYQHRNPSWPAYGYGGHPGYGYGYGGRVQVIPATPYYGYGYGAAVPRVYAPRYYQGGYLPREYMYPNYVVQDWHAHRLYAPPYGYQWMRVGSDYLLVAIATGLIISLLASGY